MINLFSDSPCVNWTLPVVKLLRKTPESRAGFPKQPAEQSSLQSQSWGRLPTGCPISKVILPFLSRPTHTHTHRHTCARAPKACSRDGFQHELLDKAVSVMLRTGSARDASWERPVRKPRDKQAGRCHSPSATPDGLNWKIASWTPQPSLNTFLKHATPKKRAAPSAFRGIE